MKGAEAKNELGKELEILEAVNRRLRILKCRKSFIAFCKVYLPQHFTDDFGPAQLELAATLQKLVKNPEPNQKPTAIAMARGYAKTTIVEFFILWCELFKFKVFPVYISDAQPTAGLVLQTLEAEIEGNEKLREDFGNLVGKKKWGRFEFLTNTGVRMMAKGARSKIRGLKSGEKRPDLLIIDDLENDKNSTTLELRDQLESWLDKAALPMLSPDGTCIMLGTIIHHDSVLNRKLKSEEWDSIKWPAIDSEGRSTWPSRFPLDKLQAIKNRIGASAFAQEYQHEPSDRTTKPFRDKTGVELERIYYTENDLLTKDPSSGKLVPKPMVHFAMLDPAFSKSKASHFAAMILVGVDVLNDYYIRDLFRTRDGQSAILDQAFAWYQKWNFVGLGVETVFNQINLAKNIEEEMAKRNIFFPILPLKSQSTNKEIRISRLVPRWDQGKIKFPKGHPLTKPILEEISDFPKGKYDDLLDALAYGPDITYPAPVETTAHIRHRQSYTRIVDAQTGYVAVVPNSRFGSRETIMVGEED
jgi:phage terminase large subunit-like protein